MSLRHKQVLVTGSAGFIGKNLVNRLLADRVEVTAVDARGPCSTKAKHLRVDILEPSESLKESIAESDVIFHLAAYSSAHMFSEFEPGFTSNVQSLLRVLDCAARTGEKKRVVFPSSSTVYPGGASPSKEDSVGSIPTNWYAASKLTGELLCKHYSRYKELETVALRIFCGYGPEEQHKGIYASPPSLFIKNMIVGKPPDVWGNGLQERDLIYVDDIVDALILGATSPLENDTFNVGTGISISFLALVGEINRVAGMDIAPNFVQPRMAQYLQKTLADTSRAEKGLGFKPKTSLRDGLAKTIDSFRGTMPDHSSNELQSIVPSRM